MKVIQIASALLLLGGLMSCVTVEPVNQPSIQIMSDDLTRVPKLSEVPEDVLKANPFIVCDHNYGEMIPPRPPITGTERAEPIVLMTRKEFNERIQLSPLWESLYNKRVSNGSYGSRYSFLTLGKLIGASSYINVESRLDGHYWKESQRITEISYGNYGLNIRSQYGHQLLEQERLEMIETLKLVIDDIDDEKAADIIDQLYKQYKHKVATKEYLSDGQTIHTYLEYDGKFIALWGSQRLDHEIKQCNYKVLSGLTIS